MPDSLRAADPRAVAGVDRARSRPCARRRRACRRARRPARAARRARARCPRRCARRGRSSRPSGPPRRTRASRPAPRPRRASPGVAAMPGDRVRARVDQGRAWPCRWRRSPRAPRRAGARTAGRGDQECAHGRSNTPDRPQCAGRAPGPRTGPAPARACACGRAGSGFSTVRTPRRAEHGGDPEPGDAPRVEDARPRRSRSPARSADRAAAPATSWRSRPRRAPRTTPSYAAPATISAAVVVDHPALGEHERPRDRDQAPDAHAAPCRRARRCRRARARWR